MYMYIQTYCIYVSTYMQGFFLCVPDCNKIKDKNNCPFERFPPLGGISCKGVGLKGNSGTKGLGP